MCIANIAYYFYLRFDDLKYPLAVINLFSLPDANLLFQSSQTVYLCDVLEGLDAIRVIPITSIKSVISMFLEHRVTRDGKLINTQKFTLLQHPFIVLAKYNTDGLFDNEDDKGTGIIE
jgi:hypothetical protein